MKIVAPLLTALPEGLACRMILCERDLDEVLDSQERMLQRNSSPERRQMLKDEYARAMGRVHATGNELLVVNYREAISNPVETAERLDRFLGGGMDIAKMAEAIHARGTQAI